VKCAEGAEDRDEEEDECMGEGKRQLRGMNTKHYKDFVKVAQR